MDLGTKSETVYLWLGVEATHQDVNPAEAQTETWTHSLLIEFTPGLRT